MCFNTTAFKLMFCWGTRWFILMIFLYAAFTYSLGSRYIPLFPFTRVAWPKPLHLQLRPWKWCQKFLWNICNNLLPQNETTEYTLTSLDIQILLPPKYLSSQKSDSLGKDPINRWVKLLTCLVRTAAMPSVKFTPYFDVLSPSKDITG